MQILFLILMFIIGAIFGSFLCCQARRLHLREEVVAQCPTRGTPERGSARMSARAPWRRERATRPEKRRIELPSRSICLHCHKQLKWHDNIPIISWLMLKGKCRHCHKNIGYAEIISELSLAFAFLGLGTYFLCLNNPMSADLLSDFPTISPMNWAIFIVTLFFTSSLAFLAIYDGIYGELPSIGFIISAVFAIALAILSAWPNFTPMPIFSALLFGGIYLILYLVSKGKWVGDGDWILAAIIGLALGHPWLSIIALLIANLAACIIMFPIVKKSKNHQVYFGPFLVLGFVITYMLSDFVMSMI
ncbi:prepilin peptidase [Candidatus Saccharibacteria bacterium]|nr:prepilin peptidase [Candidatus Saccharibacteria bacterium]